MKRIFAYLLVAFGFSWLFWVPAAMISQNKLVVSPGLENFLLNSNPAAWGPLIGAVLVTLFTEGWSGLKALLKKGVKFRLGLGWYLIVFFLFPLLIGGSLLLAVLMGDPIPGFPALERPYELPIAFLFILFLGGPLQEEFGWRGFLLEKIQTKQNALVSSIIVGVIWGLWHLPLFYMPRQEFYYQRPIWGLVLSTTLIAILFTWVYNNTGKSIFAVLIFHTVFNFSHWVFPVLGSDLASLINFILLFAVIGIVLWKWGYQTLWRRDNKTLKDIQPA